MSNYSTNIQHFGSKKLAILMLLKENLQVH